jgi:putative glycosyltransferase
MNDGDEVDVVYGVMEQRKGSVFERMSGALFYTIINFLSDLPIPENAMSARLMKRRYVEELVVYQKTQFYLSGVMMLAGFNQVGVPMQKTSKGRTSYTFAWRYTLALDALISYMNKPLTFIAFFGIAVLLVSIAMGIYCISLASGEAQGWLWVLASV